MAPLIRDAIGGKYDYAKFRPVFITRDDFFQRKDFDGYAKWIWSFGNNGKDYLFSREVESLKKAVHDYVVLGDESDLLPNFELTATDTHNRRMEWIALVKQYGKENNTKDISLDGKTYKLKQLYELEQLERIERLQKLAEIKNPERLELRTGDYHDYEYQDGDVVYCDIPYPQSKNVDYDGVFETGKFFEWLITRDFPVYFSTYSWIQEVWTREITSHMNSGDGQVKRTEALYVANARKE